jgi:hypothetical protein
MTHQIREHVRLLQEMENQYVLLLDDQSPYHFARAHNLMVVSSADFVVLLYVTGRLSYIVAAATIGRLGLGKRLARTALTVLGALAERRGERQ